MVGKVVLVSLQLLWSTISEKFGDGFLEDSCDSEFEDDVEEPGVEAECEDKNTLVMTLDISEACEDAENN